MDNILFILVFFGIVLLMVSNSSANSQLIKNLNSNQPNNKKHKKRSYKQPKIKSPAPKANVSVVKSPAPKANVSVVKSPAPKANVSVVKVDVNKNKLVIETALKKNEDLLFHYQEEINKNVAYKVAPLNIFSKTIVNQDGINTRALFLDAYHPETKKNLKFLIEKIEFNNSLMKGVENKKRSTKFHVVKNRAGIKKDYCHMCQENLTDQDGLLFKKFEEIREEWISEREMTDEEKSDIYLTDSFCWKCYSYQNNINLNTCFNCGDGIPEKRALMGFNECVDCVEERERVEGYERKVNTF